VYIITYIYLKVKRFLLDTAIEVWYNNLMSYKLVRKNLLTYKSLSN
jgi:hypothetical protein